MKQLLKALRGARIIAQGKDRSGRKIVHYLLADGQRVVEIVG